MKIYESHKSGTGHKNLCGYCRQPGHNRTECLEVEKDWAYFQDFKIPPNRGTHSWYRSRSNPKYWGDWYRDCKETRLRQLDAKVKKAAPVQRSAPKCGFCGSTNHNRRNCDLMKSFLKDCYKANENWRLAAYKVFVEDLGLDVGAAVKVRCSSTGWTTDYTEEVGLITHINWEELNVMAAFNGGWESEQKYCQRLKVKAMINGSDRWLSFKGLLARNKSASKLVTNRNSQANNYYAQNELVEVIGRSEQPLSWEWVKSYKDAFNFLVKKRSFEQLQKDGVVALIDRWK